jgi:hypothetical protein
MKKDRSNQKLTKADYEKFAYHDTRFYGLFYTKTDNGFKVKIDPKRMRSTAGCTLSDEQMKIINKRRTHYFYPKKSEYEDYCCNMFADRIRDIQNYWEEHYKKLITYANKSIKKPKKLMPGNNMLLMQGIAEYDEAVMMSNWGNMKNQYEYAEKCFELVASLYASFIHQMASQIEAVTVLVLSKQNAMYDRFDRNTLYATAVGRDKIVDELPSFKYYDKLYCLWNFIKHNSNSTYEKLCSTYPELICENREYKQGLPAFRIVKFSEELILELLSGCDSFFKEYCELVYKENYDETQWNYGRYFLNIVEEQIEVITNPLGLPWYI